MSSGCAEEALEVAEAGDVAEEVTGAEEAWVAAAGAAEAGVAEAGRGWWPPRLGWRRLGRRRGWGGEAGAGATDALSVEAGVAGGWGGGWPAYGYGYGGGCPYGFAWTYRWGCVPYGGYGYGAPGRELWYRFRWLGWRLVNIELHPLLPEGARSFRENEGRPPSPTIAIVKTEPSR